MTRENLGTSLDVFLHALEAEILMLGFLPDGPAAPG
eukprot:CAMPEP_0197671124 /NCGR_PEP_ID=MMETSP1338-20131121/76039_1 /TAXON_ID=43686 ORGANISM="Pelagodinium beii, Strain RCC1491" /NCGR_SAMPLE_ID=MMETSP1338 /ASSEMBLY_ACC=CAM_ASM_000754 /LENGTH=35 /DNA_ID= /DNA_START= /DNA_END= /DNA_ORIENTATION=